MGGNPFILRKECLVCLLIIFRFILSWEKGHKKNVLHPSKQVTMLIQNTPQKTKGRLCEQRVSSWGSWGTCSFPFLVGHELEFKRPFWLHYTSFKGIPTFSPHVLWVWGPGSSICSGTNHQAISHAQILMVSPFCPFAPAKMTTSPPLAPSNSTTICTLKSKNIVTLSCLNQQS